MSTVSDIKKFVLRMLLAAKGEPLPDAAIDQGIKDHMAPRPLQHDIDQAKRELEEGLFTLAQRDDLDPNLVTWTLTGKGQHKAAQIG